MSRGRAPDQQEELRGDKAMSQTVNKLCFVVSQIGEENSAERMSADWFLEAIVLPVLKSTFPNML
jgi:hypothetical protein